MTDPISWAAIKVAAVHIVIWFFHTLLVGKITILAFTLLYVWLTDDTEHVQHWSAAVGFVGIPAAVTLPAATSWGVWLYNHNHRLPVALLPFSFALAGFLLPFATAHVALWSALVTTAIFWFVLAGTLLYRAVVALYRLWLQLWRVLCGVWKVVCAVRQHIHTFLSRLLSRLRSS